MRVVKRERRRDLKEAVKWSEGRLNLDSRSSERLCANFICLR
jgi:hypothetical protein